MSRRSCILVFAAASVLLAGLVFAPGCGSPVAVEQPSDPNGTGGSPPPTDAANVSDDELLRRLDDVISFTGSRRLRADVNNAWQVVHGILAYGRGLEMYVDGQPVSALEHLLQGGQLKGWELVVDGGPGLEAVLEPGSKEAQGHEDQWLGYLSLGAVELNDKIVVHGSNGEPLEFTVQDLLERAQWDVYEGMEASWTLMAAGTFLPLDARWQARDGSEWTIERIVQMEAQHELGDGPCGGTHRLVGIVTALNRYLSEGGELTGAWGLAEERVQSAMKLAQQNQLPDGGFSCAFFERSTSSPNIETRLHATGHTLEFLVLAMTDEQLREPWITRAVLNLVETLESTKKVPLECGALYHAARGLLLYRTRRFGDPTQPAPSEEAPPEDAPPVAPAAESAATDETAQSEEPAADPAGS